MTTSNKPIKFYELSNWLFGPSDDLPERLNTNQINSMASYLPEMFWKSPSLIWYLNKHINNLHKIPTGPDLLIFLRKVVKAAGLGKANTWNFMPRREPDIVKDIQEQFNYDEGNAVGKVLMMKKLGVTEDRYKRQTATKQAVKKNTSTEDKQLVDNVLKIEAKKRRKKLSVSKTEPIINLTQQIIDEEQLVLFDISLLKKTNRVLFIFIDKNNNKRYYTKQFEAKIYKSLKDGVLNNDYIVDLNEKDFQPYIIKNIGLYNKLKFILNNSYKRILNVY
jgi:hypothetical protein